MSPSEGGRKGGREIQGDFLEEGAFSMATWRNLPSKRLSLHF